MISICLFRALLTAILTATAATVSLAAEITLRMKGGSFEVTGELKSFNLRAYVVSEPSLGTLTLDAARYECISANCPTRQVLPAALVRTPSEALTTNWIGGSAIGTELMPRLIRAYADSIGAAVTSQIGSDVRNLEFVLTAPDGRRLGQVNVLRKGVTPGFAAMAKGQADVVWSTRPILPEEEQIMAAAGARTMRAPDSERTVGFDPLVVVVARENPAVSLTVDAIAKIFSGQIKDWAELGLPAGKITVYAPTPEMDTWSSFESLLLTPRNLQITPDAIRLQHATEWSDRVASDPNGIGISSTAFVRRGKPVNVEMTCGLVVLPSAFGAKTEEYPLTSRMHFYTPGPPKNALAAAILDFATSNQMDKLLREARFVDFAPEFAQFRDQRARIATALNAPGEDYDPILMSQLIEDTVKAQRSSLTFRFTRGSSLLDARANDDMNRLADVLGDPAFNGKTLLLLGFSDAVGRFETNLAIARKRTALVKAALLKAVPQITRSMTIVERAFGELAPVSCNDTEEGRTLNRRVEVWVK